MLVCGVGSASVAFADVGRDAVAPLADGDAQTERYVHRTLLDGNPLRRVLRSQHVGCQIEIDPVGAEVQRQADGSAAVVDHRIASRHREPAHGVEIDRAGDVGAYAGDGALSVSGHFYSRIMGKQLDSLVYGHAWNLMKVSGRLISQKVTEK